MTQELLFVILVIILLILVVVLNMATSDDELKFNLSDKARIFHGKFHRMNGEESIASYEIDKVEFTELCHRYSLCNGSLGNPQEIFRVCKLFFTVPKDDLDTIDVINSLEFNKVSFEDRDVFISFSKTFETENEDYNVQITICGDFE